MDMTAHSRDDTSCALAAIVMIRQRERDQRASDEAHYGQLADSIRDTVIVHMDGRIVYRNPVAASPSSVPCWTRRIAHRNIWDTNCTMDWVSS